MPYVDILLDNRISCSFIETNELENVIFCRPLEESLNNVSLIQTKNTEFIHNYLEESTGNYLIGDITLENGTVYNDVRFKIVTIEEGTELPVSTINLSALGVPSATDYIPPIQLIEEDYNLIPESADEEDDFSVLYETTEIDNTSEIIQKVKRLENRLIEEQEKIDQEKVRLNEERITLDADRRLQKTLEDYKSELLQETFLVSEHQKEILEKTINSLGSSLQEQFDSQQINVGKYLDEISVSNLDELKSYQDSQVSKIKNEITALLSEHKDLSQDEISKQLLVHTDELEKLLAQKLTLELESHKRELSHEVESITTAVDKLVEEKLKIEAQNIDKLLVDRSGNLQAKFSETIDSKLDENKKSLFEEFKSASTTTASTLFSTKTEELNNALESIINEHRQGLNDTVNQKLNEVASTVSKFTADIDGKLPKLEDTIKDINKRIQNLVIEKKNVQLVVDDARKYTDTKVAQVSEEVMNYARRILDLGGGGGSNAVQYANGGTMNGSLNVTGQYLSGGVDLSTIFSGGGGPSGPVDRLNNGTVQVVLSSDNNLHFPTGTIGDTLQDGGFTIVGNPGSYAELASNDGNVFAWASDISYNNPVGGGFSIGTDTTTLTGGYIWTFGNDGLLHFPDGTIQPTAFTNNLDLYATNNFVNSNFFNLTGGTISGPTRINNNLTVFGNLTATGTTTFANTVFSTTSSLSVVHEGSGPALYVGNNGDGDIASFYDLDQNIEIFHIGGNNGSFPNVGVKTSSPNVDFTVNGQISANNTIWSAGGNSNNWNSAYASTTALNLSSGNWNSTFTTLCANSATWVKFQPLVYNADNVSDVYVNGQRFFVDVPGSYYLYTPPNSLYFYLVRADEGAGYRWYYRESSPGDEPSTYAVSTNDAAYPWLATWVGISILKAPSVDRILPKPLSAADPFGNTTYFEGSSIYAAKADHSHVYPTPIQIGAAPTIHTHVISQITNLQTTLNNKLNVSAVPDTIWTLTNGIKPVFGNNNVLASEYSIINAGQNNIIFNNRSISYDEPSSSLYINGYVYGSIIAGGNNNTIRANSSDTIVYDGDTDSYSGNIFYTNIYNSSILGGLYNTISAVNLAVVPNSITTANYNTIVGGVSGLIYNGDYNFIGGGLRNKVNGNYNSIINGQNNTLSGTNNFILGSNISVSANNYTFVNNLSSQGIISTANLTINKAPQTFVNPVTASGTFLVVNVNGTNQAIQLWNYSS